MANNSNRENDQKGRNPQDQEFKNSGANAQNQTNQTTPSGTRKSEKELEEEKRRADASNRNAATENRNQASGTQGTRDEEANAKKQGGSSADSDRSRTER